MFVCQEARDTLECKVDLARAVRASNSTIDLHASV